MPSRYSELYLIRITVVEIWRQRLQILPCLGRLDIMLLLDFGWGGFIGLAAI